MAGNNIHKGHRSRQKQEFVTRGLYGLPDHKALELLLFYAIPQGDVNPLAHRLIDTFGSFSGVFNATIDQLVQVDGVGEHTACLIKLVIALAGRYQADRSNIGEILDTTDRLGEYLAPEFFGQRNEIVVVLCLDAKGKALNCVHLSEGNVDSAIVDTRRLVEVALSCNASQVVIAHNHTSNIATPSSEDIITTKLVYDALQTLEIRLQDHLIFANDDFVSLRDSGYFRQII